MVDDLGCREALKSIYLILEKGTGADRQLELYEKTNNLKDVGGYIESKFLESL